MTTFSFSSFQSLQLSKRFCPELLNFLNGVVYLCIPKRATDKVIPFVPPFKVVGPEAELLAARMKKK